MRSLVLHLISFSCQIIFEFTRTSRVRSHYKMFSINKCIFGHSKETHHFDCIKLGADKVSYLLTSFSYSLFAHTRTHKHTYTAAYQKWWNRNMFPFFPFFWFLCSEFISHRAFGMSLLTPILFPQQTHRPIAPNETAMATPTKLAQSIDKWKHKTQTCVQ